jgi:hypothetical protein
VVLRGRSGRYRLVHLSRDRKTVSIAGRGAVKVIRYAEWLRFFDESIRIRSLRPGDDRL